MAINAFILYIIIFIFMLSNYFSHTSFIYLNKVDVENSIKYSGFLWLFAHGVPLKFDQWCYSFSPLGLYIIPFLLCYRVGKIIELHLSHTKVLCRLFIGSLTYTICSIFISFNLSKVDRLNYDIILFPFILAFLSMTIGFLKIAGYFDITQQSSLLKKILNSILRSSFISIFAGLAISSFFFAYALISNWLKAIIIYESLELTMFGVLIFFIVQALYIPNILIWTFSWIIGVGFVIGENAIISPTFLQVGTIPPIPVFAAIPQQVNFYSTIFIVLIIICNIIAGFWFRKYEPMELNKEIEHQIDSYILRRLISALFAGFMISLFSGMYFVFIAWLGSGSAGLNKLNFVGIYSIFDFSLHYIILSFMGAFTGYTFYSYIRSIKVSSFFKKSKK